MVVQEESGRFAGATPHWTLVQPCSIPTWVGCSIMQTQGFAVVP